MSTGVYNVHVLAYDGVTGLAIGNNLSQLGGCFDLSNAFVLDRIICDPACQAPLNFRVVQLTSNKFYLTWDRSAGAYSYELLIGFEGSSLRYRVPLRNPGVIVSTRITNTILAKVRAVCGYNSYSAYTDYVSFMATGTRSFSADEESGDIYGDFVIDEPSLDVFPNPTKNFINLEFQNHADESLLQIMDATGRSVYSSELQEGEIRERIAVSDFDQGIYQVIITKDGELLDQTRFIKI